MFQVSAIEEARANVPKPPPHLQTGRMSKHSSILCTNCGDIGHLPKQCQQPVTSFGTILFRVRGAGWNQQKALLGPSTSINGLEPADTLEFLLIQRRDSLGFIDIMRGKYKHNDYEYIVTQLKGMTREEQQRLLHEPFESLWEKLWGPPAAGTNPYRHEKEMSRAKLEALRTGTPSLEMLLNRIHEHLPWDTPEWGFPKGRRDPHETEFSCALREMWEETGLSEKDVVPIKNLEPLTEIFTGSNHVNYCHKYYVLYEPSGRPIQYDPTNELMKREVGDIRWCTLEEGLALIRPENSEKREILAQAHRLLRKYCPFHLADLGNSQK